MDAFSEIVRAEWGAATGAVVVALAVHGVAVVGRRRARVLRERARDASSRGGRVAVAIARMGSALVTFASISAWLVALLLVSERFSLLMRVRDSALWTIVHALTEPIVHVGARSYSIAQLAELPLLLAVAWTAGRVTARLVQSRIARGRAGMNGAAESVGFLLRYGVTFVGGFVALQTWGIDLSSLALVASVLGVGIGFGLQNLANNFVSGIVISLERPVRVGDYIQVGELIGTVERIGGRSTQVRTRDNISIVVPNSQLLENEVVNWTLGDPRTRLHLAVGVAYGSDLRRARAALLDAAASHPGVLAKPAPEVDLDGFGESSLELDLEVWTDDPRKEEDLKSDLYYRIEQTLRQHGIEIPFPQRDLHLRSPELDRFAATLGVAANATMDHGLSSGRPSARHDVPEAFLAAKS
jgi:potassium efflux system protein